MRRRDSSVTRLERLARQTERRLRSQRALRAVATALCAALLLSIASLALRKVGAIGEMSARILLFAVAGLVAAVGAVAWSWPLPPMAGARALDRHHGLHDRLANALAFGQMAESGRTPFMALAIDDAIAASTAVRPHEAVPLAVPGAMPWAAALAAVFAAMTLFEVRTRAWAVHAPTLDGIEMAPDDLEDVRDFLKQLDARDPTADTRAAIEEFNRLVEDIANRRLDRTEAFRRLAGLEEKLLTGSAADRQALERQLEAMGDELKKADLTRPAGAALSEDQLAKARDALHDLAKKLRAPTAADKAKVEAVRDALKKAADRARERQAALERRREELADEILKARSSLSDGGSDQERSLLEKKQQELERLDRERSEQRSAGQQLDRLDRELEQAAEDLMKDLGLGAQDLDQGAEDLNRMAEQQMSQQEKEELRQKLQEVRELLRQQSQPGQSGKSQVIRLKRFGQMARGQAGQGGHGGQGGGESGSSQQSDSESGGATGGAGTRGQSASQGQGQAGAGGQRAGGNGSEGSGGGETWIVGPNGEKLLMLSKGRGAGGTDEGQGRGGDGSGSPGTWGDGHDPKVQGKATHAKMGTEDTQVQSSDTGQGGSRSQVILGAAERGFTSRHYQKVYAEYHQVAEESLVKDDIPGGYRFYVKRYFQLIRPRDTP